MSAIDKLYHILSELESHKRTKSEAMSAAITDRLQSSLDSYTKSLNDSVSYLSSREHVNLLRRLSKDH